jgi:hypothetical protein
MNDNSKNEGETEPVCAPLIRLQATMQRGPDRPSTIEHTDSTDCDQTEPCDFAPIIRLQA